MSSSLGIKRGREDSSLYERTVMCCAPSPLRFRLSSVTDKHTADKDTFLGVGRELVCSDVDERNYPRTSSPVWLNKWCGSDMTSIGARLGPYRRNVVNMQTVSVCSEIERTLLPPDRRVVVDVIRGDTGKCYRFTFLVPSPSLFSGPGRDRAADMAYRNVVVRELLNQVCIEALLTLDRAWNFVFYGRNIQSEAGAELLMSSLYSESCQRILLAVFYGLERR